MQLPPQFNFPKSQLQCYGESIYSSTSDLLSRCNTGQSPLERLIFVVAWSISTTRPAIFGVAPYNPTLGETHHVSKGNLNVLLEQAHAFTFCYMLNVVTKWLHLIISLCCYNLWASHVSSWHIMDSYFIYLFAGFTPPSCICPPCNWWERKHRNYMVPVSCSKVQWYNSLTWYLSWN